MDDKIKEEFIQLFNQGFEEVILHQMEDIMDKMEQTATKDDIERLERKIDRIVDKDIDQDHRLEAIEATPVIAHELRSKKHQIKR